MNAAMGRNSGSSPQWFQRESFKDYTNNYLHYSVNRLKLNYWKAEIR